MGRRGEDAETGGETVAAAEWTWTVPHVMCGGGYLVSEQSQPQARLHSPGFQHWEDKFP